MNQASRIHLLTIVTAAAGLLTAAWADEPVLRIAGSDVATVGQPAFLPSLGVEVRP